MTIKIARPLPGELEGKVNPEDYGFEVERDEHPETEEEQKLRVGRLYAQLKERTGHVVPEFEPYLETVEAEQAPPEEAGAGAGA